MAVSILRLKNTHIMPLLMCAGLFCGLETCPTTCFIKHLPRRSSIELSHEEVMRFPSVALDSQDALLVSIMILAFHRKELLTRAS